MVSQESGNLKAYNIVKGSIVQPSRQCHKSESGNLKKVTSSQFNVLWIERHSCHMILMSRMAREHFLSPERFYQRQPLLFCFISHY